MEVTNLKLYKVNPTSTAQLLISEMTYAESFFDRAKGLLGRTQLADNAGLWIKPCNNIHTFFMKFSIDCIFVNDKLEVQKLFKTVKPFKIIGPVWKAKSVIEVNSGAIDKWNLNVGDQLYVVN